MFYTAKVILFIELLKYSAEILQFCTQINKYISILSKMNTILCYSNH